MGSFRGRRGGCWGTADKGAESEENCVCEKGDGDGAEVSILGSGGVRDVRELPDPEAEGEKDDDDTAGKKDGDDAEAEAGARGETTGAEGGVGELKVCCCCESNVEGGGIEGAKAGACGFKVGYPPNGFPLVAGCITVAS